jgi:hypothetical protein
MDRMGHHLNDGFVAARLTIATMLADRFTSFNVYFTHPFRSRQL